LKTFISVLNEERPGRSIEVTTDEIIHKIEDNVLADRRMNIREIVEIRGISSEPVQNIVHKYRMTASKRNPKEFLRRFVTVDETWIHHYMQK
jgi:hypothetical protein